MLKRQLYSVFILSLLLPIVVISSMLLYNNYKLLYTHHKDMVVSDNLRVRSVIFEVTTFATNLSDAIARDPALTSLISQTYLTPRESQPALDNFNLLEIVYRMYTPLASITLYTDNPTLPDYEHIKTISDANQTWFR